MRRTAPLAAIAAAGLLLVVPAAARADAPANTPNPGSISGGQSSAPQTPPAEGGDNGNCSAAKLALNAINPFSHCNAASQAVNAVGQVPGDAAGAAGAVAGQVAGDVMDQVASWMVTAAQTVDGDVMKAASATSTPELSAQWYEQEFQYLALFAAALAGIVALLGVVSASVRGDPYALGEIFYGVLRAGLVTAMVISLTLLALKVADGISSDVAQNVPRQFFSTLASAWGAKGWGGFASSALAFVTALVEVIVAVLLWIELLFRDAAIYVAVLFFPFTLAMAIWPRLAGAHSKLVRVLGIFIAFKPVALIMMMTGANLLLGGVSFYGGLGPSVGTILVGLAVLAMAAFAPWSLLHLVGLDAGTMSSSGSGSGARGGRSGGSSSGGGGEGAVGGELFGGAVSAGAASAATAAVGGTGGGGTRLGGGAHSLGGPGAPSLGGPARSGAAGGGRMSASRMLPGPVAAAAGLLPAGWQAAQSAGARAQTLASHGAARVHTASGHGGSKPLPVGGATNGIGHGGAGQAPAGVRLPSPPPAGTPAPKDAGRASQLSGPMGSGGLPTPPPPAPAPPQPKNSPREKGQ